MAKPNPLSAVAAQVAESMGKAQDKPQPVALASYTPEPAPAAPAKTSREGKRFLGYYVEPTRHEEIKQAAPGFFRRSRPATRKSSKPLWMRASRSRSSCGGQSTPGWIRTVRKQLRPSRRGANDGSQVRGEGRSCTWAATLASDTGRFLIRLH